MGNNNALTVVEGSLLQVVNASNTTIADAFMDVNAVAIIDESGSMQASDSTGGRSRYEVACDELAKLQRKMPGRFLVLGFSDNVFTRIGGVPEYQGGSTDMAKALKHAKEFDVTGITFYLISDGEPNYGTEDETLAVAQSYTQKINTVFVGPESDQKGRAFLQRLSDAVGSKSVMADRVMELAQAVETLMLGSGG